MECLCGLIVSVCENVFVRQQQTHLDRNSMPYSVYRTLCTYRVERIGNNFVCAGRRPKYLGLGILVEL